MDMVVMDMADMDMVDMDTVDMDMVDMDMVDSMDMVGKYNMHPIPVSHIRIADLPSPIWFCLKVFTNNAFNT